MGVFRGGGSAVISSDMVEQTMHSICSISHAL